MSTIAFSAIASLDGYTVDASGSFDWAAPDADVHAFVNDLERDVGTYVYGRRMYETMRVWQTLTDDDDDTGVMADYADIWRGADKLVVSSTLDEVTTPRTRLVRTFDAEAVRDLADASDRSVGIGGPTLAAEAFRAGIVDEVQLFVVPIAVGGGTPAFPLGLTVALDLVDERRFAGGVVYLRYRVRREPGDPAAE
ncbi:dihydrofolate reductase family protein [Leifsonia sp. NPDC058292]|uniref:dihydrofolate reductase family protein n=1 Tax=Leifsonia sp. NPDC058292 TaxID=3346428 RepID=UPI0036D8DBCB